MQPLCDLYNLKSKKTLLLNYIPKCALKGTYSSNDLQCPLDVLFFSIDTSTKEKKNNNSVVM